MVATFRSSNIVDLVSVDDPSDGSSPVGRSAYARSFVSTPDDGQSTVSQIVGSDSNIFCTKSLFSLDGSGLVSLDPGFSYLNLIQAVWDPLTITLNLYIGDSKVGSATVSSEAQLLSVPLQGVLNLVVPVEGVDEPLAYQTLVRVYGYPLATDFVTWFDWVSRGDVIFPLTFALTTDRMQINNEAFVAAYSVLADPLNTIIHPRNGARTVPFVKDQTFPLFTVAQYQYAAEVSYIGH